VSISNWIRPDTRPPIGVDRLTFSHGGPNSFSLGCEVALLISVSSIPPNSMYPDQAGFGKAIALRGWPGLWATDHSL
jgi:hypothetical protein